MKYVHVLSFLFAFTLPRSVQRELLGSSVCGAEDALRKHSSTSGWMAGSWWETEIWGQTPSGSQCKPVFPASRCRPNKRCPLDRLFSGKNSLTRLTRNAVICKAFPAKRFISGLLGNHQTLFFLSPELSSYFSWCNSSSFISNMHLQRGGHNNRNKSRN